mgnify:CR=1 FL=1|jgi:hypothetical protein
MSTGILESDERSYPKPYIEYGKVYDLSIHEVNLAQSGGGWVLPGGTLIAKSSHADHGNVIKRFMKDNPKHPFSKKLYDKLSTSGFGGAGATFAQQLGALRIAKAINNEVYIEITPKSSKELINLVKNNAIEFKYKLLKESGVRGDGYMIYDPDPDGNSDTASTSNITQELDSQYGNYSPDDNYFKEDFMSFKQFYEQCNICANELKKGDYVENINTECDHFRSKGVVLGFKEIPQDDDRTAGRIIVYRVDNNSSEFPEDKVNGKFSKGDRLAKTEIQLKKIK